VARPAPTTPSEESPIGLRIALFHVNLPQAGRKPGGVAVYVDRLARNLSRRGNDVEVLTYSAAPPDVPYRVRRLPFKRAESSRFARQYLAPWLLNFHRFGDRDVAHFHGDDWFLLRRELPIVRTFHGSALLEARSATSLKRRLDKSVVYPLELVSARLATSSYGVGTDSAEIYQTDGLLPPGVDPTRSSAPKSPHPTILFVGNWSDRKRGEMLQRKFVREIRPALPDAELWMVSDRCEPATGVRWFQAPSDEDLVELYARSWVFCLPSSYEGFGIPYLEAMAQGSAVVATPNPGSRMLIEDGRYGVLCEAEQLGSCLLKVLGDEQLRASLAGAGRERAEEFSWDRIAERHEIAYRQAINRWRERGRGHT
jgi:glycosyltransferase involved in cell wall biosynthesis